MKERRGGGGREDTSVAVCVYVYIVYICAHS